MKKQSCHAKAEASSLAGKNRMIRLPCPKQEWTGALIPKIHSLSSKIWLQPLQIAPPGTMEKVKIPTKVLLDAMMQQLGLPNAAYSTHKGRPAGLDATIHFYPCKHHLDNKLPMKSMSIHVFSNLEEAEDRLATEALKCMEDSYGTVLQDHSYNKLQLAQQKCRSLEHQQREKDGVIDYFSSSWCM